MQAASVSFSKETPDTRPGVATITGASVTPLEVLRRWEHSGASPVSDEAFDAMYPEQIAELSEMFWTPVAVALRCASLLVEKPEDRILDVGSGVGKFCLIGAATSEGTFHGIEQRSELVDVAEGIRASHTWARQRVSFKTGNMSEENWDNYQGIYLFNPFFEQSSGPFCQIDDSIPYSRETQQRYIETALQKLASTRKGTRVATYFGFGATLPTDFRKIHYDLFDKGPLEVWIKEG